jgi:hypothetical protein
MSQQLPHGDYFYICGCQDFPSSLDRKDNCTATNLPYIISKLHAVESYFLTESLTLSKYLDYNTSSRDSNLLTWPHTDEFPSSDEHL